MFLGVDYPGTKDVQNNHSDKFVVDENTMRTRIMATFDCSNAEILISSLQQKRAKKSVSLYLSSYITGSSPR
ncbi:hypothetical protein DO659_24820 [Salmonella enterica subsp. enterica serovar Minnesota]|nr:hypothetical protein [Salmonella enterica subsp. enterica serovar Minnesota]